jgi:hypothetical protein
MSTKTFLQALTGHPMDLRHVLRKPATTQEIEK